MRSLNRSLLKPTGESESKMILQSGSKFEQGGQHFKCTRAQSFSHVRLFAPLWTVAYQAPLSIGYPRQEYWSGVPSPPLGDRPDPWIKPVSPTLAGRFFTTATPGEVSTLQPHLSQLLHNGCPKGGHN